MFGRHTGRVITVGSHGWLLQPFAGAPSWVGEVARDFEGTPVHFFSPFRFQNFSVELQLENHGEFSHDHFKLEVDKAAGARYGTGVRDL